MSWIEHHKISESLASQAQAALDEGRRDDALALFARAARAEDQAIKNLSTSKKRTLAVSAVSAVSLYYKAAEFELANDTAVRWLNSDLLPRFAKEQLRRLCQAIRAEKTRAHTRTPSVPDQPPAEVREAKPYSAYESSPSILRDDWAGIEAPIGTYILSESEGALGAYRSQPSLVDEHASLERSTAHGGYAHRQIVELAQNAADQLADTGGRITILLTPTHLYVADNGHPLDTEGAKALMHTHLSPKRRTTQRRGTTPIGRFGVGFKSVLGVTDSPGVFSRTGSFVFDRASAAERIRVVVRDAGDYPVLRVAEPVDPRAEAAVDQNLASLMNWSVNIVRLPLKHGMHDELLDQIRDFRAEFLLFVSHVNQVDLVSTHNAFPDRTLRLVGNDGLYDLIDGGQSARWRVFCRTHELSPEAQSDFWAVGGDAHVTITWAAPIDRPINHHHFWNFFPTQTTSLVSGIFNAPWKTNEDRQNLLRGKYNNELIDSAAALVADSLLHLHTSEDPARHLDSLGGRIESDLNEHASCLANAVYSTLRDRKVIPDLDGAFCTVDDISIPPVLGETNRKFQIGMLERWSEYEHRPSNWLHHSATSPNRLATVDRIHAGHGRRVRWDTPTASIAQWLQALTAAGSAAGDAIQASSTAIRIAALLPENVRNQSRVGEIVFTAAGKWASPGRDTVYLTGGLSITRAQQVHSELESDRETLEALVALGVTPPTQESEFRKLVSALFSDNLKEGELDARWRRFWTLARSIDVQAALEAVSSNTTSFRKTRVMTKSGDWHEIREVLLPGPIVSEDGDEDANIVVDLTFHAQDKTLLEELGARIQPMVDDASFDPDYHRQERAYLAQCRESYSRREDLPQNPQWYYLDFERPPKIRPLDAFTHLSEEGNCRFTNVLLNLDESYEEWVMHHRTRDIYPYVQFPSIVIFLLRKYGCVETPDGIHKLSDGLSETPTNPDVQRWLLQHPRTHRIRDAFPDLKSSFEGFVEPIGDDEPTPLIDEWPGLGELLALEEKTLLIRCDRLVAFDGRDAPTDCARLNGAIYLLRNDDEASELRAVIRELGAYVGQEHFDRVLQHDTPNDVWSERQKVREQPTDPERLLAAVGEEALRLRLPPVLVQMLEHEPEPLTGIRVAEAAIATYHTGALREYRHWMHRLRPPARWAGSPAAIEFVRDLGFGMEWAGRRHPKRSQHEDVTGPYKLPPPHEYQKVAIANVRTLLGAPIFGGENRGLLSLPTGSGKTRVAVEGIIDAIREDGFDGTILWIADRDELCEQAVESWQQAWSAIGPEARRLRISRLWGGQGRPVATEGTHVVVATRQTLTARGVKGPDANDPLNDVRLLVVDEAHGSIAPSYTSIMTELGLTFRRREGEICLLGLTATPYRGRDEEETERLVNRYGRNRLDSGAFRSEDPEDVIRELQCMKVLAKADHLTIEGSNLRLDEQELRQIIDSELPWLPDSVERRIAGNAERTRRIVEAYESQIQKMNPTWPTLIFATSVNHAETVAAMLQLRGVESRAVSSGTESWVRRSVVEQFRAGEVRALVNYGVFREGFDAPKTRAIIVARPVYSPNLYFQMIGRGLRGVLNGGSDRCLILDVEDNIENYDRALSFSELDWLWD